MKEETFEGQLVPLSRVWKLTLPEWKFLVLGVSGAVVNAAVFPVWGVLLTKIIVLFYDERPRSDLLSTARYWSLGFLALGVVFGVSIMVQHYGFAVASQRLVARVRLTAYQAMLRQEIAWFDEPDNSSRALVGRLSTDATVLQSMTSDVLNQGLVTLTTLVIAFCIAFVYSWEMTLLILAAAPVLIFMSTIQAHAMSGIANANPTSKGDTDAGSLVVEALGSIRTVAALGLETTFETRYAALLVGSRQSHLNTGIIGGVAFGGCEATMFFVTALLFYCGGKWVNASRITFEDMLMVIMVIMLSMVGVGNATQNAADQAKARQAASRIFCIIDRTPTIDAIADDGHVLDHVYGEIEFKNVAFAYPSRPDAPVYTDYNLIIGSGQMVTLVGASGSGKSTAIALLERFYDPSSGCVTLDGADVRSLRLPWIREHIALVSQEPVLFSGTIRENIAFGKPGASHEELIDAARKANAFDFISNFPDSFDTKVGDAGVQVSGGQRQRIAIARAILSDPEILLLDEATSALDNESERLVQQSLEQLVAAKRHTTIVVAHRLSTIRHADVIAVIQDGAVVEQGTHDELIAISDGVYRALVARQAA